MSLKICILGSGSSGNAIYVASPHNQVLIDAGLSGRETERRLAQIGVDPDKLDAVCVSHEHGDHTAGLAVMHKKHGAALYGNSATVEAITRGKKYRDLPWHVFTNGASFAVGEMHIEPFSVPHDAYDPVGFTITVNGIRAGIVTDIGVCTNLVRQRLQGCHALVVEANHDEFLVQQSPRPWYIKQRVLGRQGHLSNTHAADLLADIASPDLQHVFLTHISEDCNSEELALKTVREKLDQSGYAQVTLSLSYADQVSALWEYDGRPAVTADC